jgi:hypothetical protein
MADRASPRVVAVFNASDELVDLLHLMRGISGVYEFILCRFHTLKKGWVDFTEYLWKHDPHLVIFDISPPYHENWQFFQTLRAATAMKGRRQVLITTNKTLLDAALGEDSHTIDIVGSPDVLHQIVTAIESVPDPDTALDTSAVQAALRRKRRTGAALDKHLRWQRGILAHGDGDKTSAEPPGRTAASADHPRATHAGAPRTREGNDVKSSEWPPTTIRSPDANARPTPGTKARALSPLDDHLQRVRDAYRDSPNLRLTPSQAQRMFELESQVCVAVLNALLNEAFLLRTREGVFVRRARPHPEDTTRE